MARQAVVTFRRQLAQIDHTRRRMERLHKAGKIRLRDLHVAYEALFLRAVTHFEVFLESLFFGILQRDVLYRKRGVKKRFRAHSADAMREILLQGEKYLDWLPYSRTEKRAKLYLEDGKPFCELPDRSRGTIQTITYIRNAIAHLSEHSEKEFRNKVIGDQPVLGSERKPASFLRSQVRTGPVRNRFEVYVSEVARIAVSLCEDKKQEDRP